MARRNMKQIIKDTSVPNGYDITFNELSELARESKPSALIDAFKYGFALGMRCQKRRGGKR